MQWKALGLAIAPALTGDAGIDPLRDGSDTGRWHARIFNISTQYAATKLHFEATFEDGVTVKDELERLGPGETWTVQLRVIEMPPGGPSLEEAGRNHSFATSISARFFAISWSSVSSAPDALTARFVPRS